MLLHFCSRTCVLITINLFLFRVIRLEILTNVKCIICPGTHADVYPGWEMSVLSRKVQCTRPGNERTSMFATPPCCRVSVLLPFITLHPFRTPTSRLPAVHARTQRGRHRALSFNDRGQPHYYRINTMSSSIC